MGDADCAEENQVRCGLRQPANLGHRLESCELARMVARRTNAVRYHKPDLERDHIFTLALELYTILRSVILMK